MKCTTSFFRRCWYVGCRCRRALFFLYFLFLRTQNEFPIRDLIYRLIELNFKMDAKLHKKTTTKSTEKFASNHLHTRIMFFFFVSSFRDGFCTWKLYWIILMLLAFEEFFKSMTVQIKNSNSNNQRINLKQTMNHM